MSNFQDQCFLMKMAFPFKKTGRNFLNNGEEANRDLFFDKIKKLNYRNSIFVDNTASLIVSETL